MVEQIRFHQPLSSVRLRSYPAFSPEQEEKIQELEQAAYQRGKQDGERALGEQLVRQRAELLEIQNGVFNSLREAVPQVIRDSEQALVGIALETARKLVAGLPITPETVEASIREALGRVEDTAELIVALHPEDLALLEKVNSPLLLADGSLQPLRFQSSSEVTRGGCVVQTRYGVIDGRRETKMELLKHALLE